ncbi:MAG: MBL fold metallo-hydrolase [Bdellovibrionales bacterium]
MVDKQELSRLTCEQVYNLWISEPEILQIFDIRSEKEFEASHIPGAQLTPKNGLSKRLESLGDKLAVVVSGLDHDLDFEQLKHHKNFVFMSQCHRWSELNYPLTGKEALISFVQNEKRQGAQVNNEIIFHQLFEPESSTYTYIIADKKSKEAAIIDPVLETVDRDLKLIEELGLNLLYVLDTHIHADHITGAGEIRKRTKVKTAVSCEAEVSCVDIPLEEGQELLLGDKKIKVIATPGHTNTCLTYAFEDMLFTGDALLIRGCGRTDFQQGSSDKLFHSVREKLFKLPDETIVYPGHDYRGLTSSTIGTEKRHNARLKESIDLSGFKKIMSVLKLANPKKIHEAVPANLACGKPKDSRTLHPQIVDGVPEITVEDLFKHMNDVKTKKIRLIDVRRPDEFNNELGHIDGSELVTLGPELTQFLQSGDRSEEIIFICRSGGRSGTAALESIKLGYKFTINMAGGMLRWNEKKLPIIKN